MNDEETYFVQGFEYGLMAAWKPRSNSTFYYEFDGDGLDVAINSL